jgi:hypothetical protein
MTLSGSLRFVQLESHPINRFFELEILLLLNFEMGFRLTSDRQVLFESLDFMLQGFDFSVELPSVPSRGRCLPSTLHPHVSEMHLLVGQSPRLAP